jgi:hypothetical protein
MKAISSNPPTDSQSAKWPFCEIVPHANWVQLLHNPLPITDHYDNRGISWRDRQATIVNLRGTLARPRCGPAATAPLPIANRIRICAARAVVMESTKKASLYVNNVSLFDANR